MSRRRTGPPVFFGKEQQMENLETTAGGLPALQDASAEELAQAIYDVLDAKKAHDVKLLPVGDKTVLAEYFVICTGNSSTQVKALAGELERLIGERGMMPYGVEGRDNNSWIILDYSHVIVHIFSREAREFYKLEKLYSD
mgnify:CR=1 FL=1